MIFLFQSCAGKALVPVETIRKPDGFASQKLFVFPESMQKELAESEWTKDLFVTDIGYFPHARHHYRERPHGCDSHIFIYCAEGEGWIEAEGERKIRLESRQLAVIPAGKAHRYGASDGDPWSIYWFHLQGERVGPLMRLYGLEEGPLTLTLGAHAMLTDGFEQAYGLLTDKPYSWQARAHVSHTIRHMLSSVGLSAGRSKEDRKRERYLEQAVRYMTDRLADSLTLADLARATGLSKQHLIYLFNRETGRPPVEYYLRLKMQRAGQLLDLTDLSVKEIAGAVGISDPYYFSRLFKRMMGCSPTEYRNIPKG